jgi:hypothetical protein
MLAEAIEHPKKKKKAGDVGRRQHGRYGLLIS